MKEVIANMMRGFAMGTADIIPGVSGGTIAYILGIYPRLITAIRHADSIALGHLARLRLGQLCRHMDIGLVLPLAIGIGGALWFFTHIIILADLLRHYPTFVYAAFFGLVLASLMMLFQETGAQGIIKKLWITIGIAIGYMALQPHSNLLPAGELGYFFAGVAAISAMLLPGISGSLLLLMLGVYTDILDAVNAKNMAVLTPLLIGMLVGALTTSRVLYMLYQHHRTHMLCAINGLLVSSLLLLWPFKQTDAYKNQTMPLDALRWPDIASVTDLTATAIILVSMALISALRPCRNNIS